MRKRRVFNHHWPIKFTSDIFIFNRNYAVLLIIQHLRERIVNQAHAFGSDVRMYTRGHGIDVVYTLFVILA